MNEVLTYIAVFVAGWIVREQWAMFKIHKIVKMVQEEEAKEVTSKQHELKVTIEESNGIFYLYKEVDGMFIAQGTSKADVAKILEKDYSGFTIVADPDNIKEVGFK
jgi:protein-disulfide isomerase